MTDLPTVLLLAASEDEETLDEHETFIGHVHSALNSDTTRLVSCFAEFELPVLHADAPDVAAVFVLDYREYALIAEALDIMRSRGWTGRVYLNHTLEQLEWATDRLYFSSATDLAKFAEEVAADVS